MLRYLSLDIICSSKLTVFLELRSRKTVRFSEQITSADKYLSIFSRQMEAIVYLLLLLFVTLCTGLVLVHLCSGRSCLHAVCTVTIITLSIGVFQPRNFSLLRRFAAFLAFFDAIPFGTSTTAGNQNKSFSCPW